LVFLIVHFDTARKPFLLRLTSIAPLAIGLQMISQGA
jgi:hypothetical protein